MRARYYDPITGHFISEGPLGFGGGDVNLMIYAGSNPVLYSDPSGEIIFTGTAAAYIFVVAPVVARYGPVVARAARRYGPAIARTARSGYAQVASAASRTGQTVMNFARSHPVATQRAVEFTNAAVTPYSPASTVAGVLGAEFGDKILSGRSSRTPPKP